MIQAVAKATAFFVCAICAICTNQTILFLFVCIYLRKAENAKFITKDIVFFYNFALRYRHLGHEPSTGHGDG